MLLPSIMFVALALPAAASAAAAFRTPGRAAYCGLTEGEGPAALICWTPNDGFSIGMGVRGRPTHSYNALDRGYYEDAASVLRFGQAWNIFAYRCTSRATGLTCTNRGGHGWWLGRYKGYRIF
jgi:hypothetical protein